MSRLTSIALAWAATAATACTHAPPPRVAAPPSPAAIAIADGGPATGFLQGLPMQVWPAHGARAVGLLVASESAAGPLIGWGRFFAHDEHRTQAAPYWFLTGGGSAQAVYFASHGEGQNFLPRWSVPTPSGAALFDAAMYAPDTDNQLGLHAAAHLVDVEVNGGRGSVPYLHFVVTDLRILDGTPQFPIVAADALAAARAQWDRWLAAHADATAALLAEGSRLTPGQPFGPEVDRTEGGLFPTWLEDDRVLRVSFYQRTVRSSSKTEERIVAPHCPRGAPCMAPRPQQVTSSRSYGVEAALTIDLDDHGRVVRMTGFGPTELERSYIAPPP